MRTRMEIKEKFIELSRKIVRQAFKKRNLMKMDFSKEEMEKIKEIDLFLRTVSLDNTEDLEKQFRDYKQAYFCVVVKMKIRIRGTDMECFIHHYVKMEDFDYEKCPFYIAKAIYTISKNKHAEIYFCVNGLKVGHTETGLYLPERKQKNICMASSLFVDLDLKGDYATMENEELLKAFEQENREFMDCFQPFMIRSGGGIHLYIPIETIDLTSEEQRNQWKDAMRDLAFLLHKWGADMNCIDSCRILRTPYGRNRKEKYGTNGLEVSVMRKSETRFTLEDASKKINWLIKGGDKQCFESILEEIFYYEEGEQETNEEDDVMNNFFPIDFKDDIFPEEPTVYVPKQIFIEEAKRLERMEREIKEKEERERKAKEKETQNIRKEKSLERPVHFGEVSENVENSYQGICVDYDSLPNILWQSKDLLFYLSNRRNHEGCRNNMLFFFAFNAYYFERKHKLDELLSMCQWINKTYFKPSLSEEEVNNTIKHWHKKFEVNIRTKYIRNETIQKYFPFTDKEKEYTIGNYYSTDSKEFLEKNKKTHAKRSLESHHKKRESKGIESLKSKQEKTKQFIREHPDATYSKAKEILGIGESFFYRERKAIQEELGLRKEKNDYESAFKKNPNITYEEFHKMFGVTKCTYFRNKRKYLNNT